MTVGVTTQEGLQERLGPLFADFAEPLYAWGVSPGGGPVLVGANAAARAEGGGGGCPPGRAASEVLPHLPRVVADLEAWARGEPTTPAVDSAAQVTGDDRHLLVSWTALEPGLVVVATRDATAAWRRAERERERAADLERVSSLVQALLGSEHPTESREVLCETARCLALADAVYLLEPDGDDLLQTASAGAGEQPDREPLRRPAVGRSLAAEVVGRRQGVFVPDTLADGHASALVHERSGWRSGFFQPVVAGERVLGVLAVVWSSPRPTPPPMAERLVPLLAAQAGAVIARTDHLAQLTELAGKDPLTGLPNRRSWDDELERTLALSRRHLTPLCVVVLDVDGLKLVNDREGHRAGDDLLREAARLWSGQLRTEDFLARLGGDEFGVLVPGLRLAETERIVHRLTAAAPQLSAAAGIAEWDGRESAGALVHRADAAMYVHKRSR